MSSQLDPEKNNQETIKNWQGKLNEIQVPKILMNRLVLNFLIVEGYAEGARKFIKEASIDLEDPANSDLIGDLNDEDKIKSRIQVRKCILDGNIKQAIFLINDKYPTLLDQKADLNFELRK